MGTEDTMSIAEIFNAFQDYLNNEQEVREVRIITFFKNVVLIGYRPYRKSLSVIVFLILKESS